MLLRIVAGASTGALLGAVACGGGEFKAASQDTDPDAAMVTMGVVPSSGDSVVQGVVVNPDDGGDKPDSTMLGSSPAPDGGDPDAHVDSGKVDDAGKADDGGKDADVPDVHVIGIGVIVGLGVLPISDAGTASPH
jgi:hypothetical protein